MPVTTVVFDVGGVLLLPSGERMASALETALGLRLSPDACRDGWTAALAGVELDAYVGHEPLVLDHTFLERAGRALDLLSETNRPSVFDRRWMVEAGVPAHLATKAFHVVDAANKGSYRSLWSDHVPGGAAVLEELARRGLRLGAVSNSDGRVERELRADGLADAFEVVVDSSAVGVWKPDPRIFGFCLDAMRVDPSECLYVGDTLTFDVAGAVAAGLQPCHFDRLGLYGPPNPGLRRIEHLDELVELTTAS